MESIQLETKSKLQIAKGVTSLVLVYSELGNEKENEGKFQFLKWNVESLFKHTDKPFELIIVNNKSSEKTKQWLDNLHEHYTSEKCLVVKHYPAEKNLGWTGGVNAGIELSEGEYVAFLNDDLIFSPNWLSKMLVHLREDVGFVGPTSNYVSGRQNVSLNEPGVTEERVNFLIGLLMLSKREFLEQIKDINEGEYMDNRYYPGGSDDFDLSLLTKKLGKKLVIARDVFVHHFGSQTLNLLPEFREGKGNEFYQDRLKLLREKWGNEIVDAMEYQICPELILGIPTVGFTHNLFLTNYPWVVSSIIKKVGHRGILPVTAARTLVDIARNEIVKNARLYGAEWIYMIDDDMVFDTTTFSRMWEHTKREDLDIRFITATAFKRSPPFFPCYVKGTLVETEKGQAEIEKIKKGDLVKTHKGNFKKVTGTSKTYLGKGRNGELVWISTNNNYRNIGLLRSTLEHPYYIFRNNKKQWVEAKDLNTDDLMLYPYEKKNSYLELNYSTYHRKPVHKKIKIDEDFARFLGLYLAEGCGDDGSLRFSFNKKEKEYINFVSSILEKNFDGKPSIMNNLDGSSTTISISRKGLGLVFNVWFNKGPRNKRIPEFVFDWDLRNRLAFIKGYIEGDGCITNAKERGARFTTARKKLALDLKNLCEQSGLRIGKIYKNKSSISKWNNRKIKSNGNYQAVISAKSWYKLLDLLEGNIRDKYISIPIKKVETKRNWHTKYVYNLEVEDDNSYIVNSSAVHNCLFKGKDEQGRYLPIKTLNAGLQKVDASGLSCALIHMSVFDEVEKEFPDEQLFNFRTKFGEDIRFVEKVRLSGITPWADTSLHIGHIGPERVITADDWAQYNEEIKNNKN